MKAAVFHKPKDIRYEDFPDPRIEDPKDVIVKVSKAAICGSDLHIYNGLLPQMKKFVVGHEFMGTVADVGSEVSRLKKGDRVVVPFPIACGRCFFCVRGAPTGCENSNPDFYGPKGGILAQKGGGFFGLTDLYGGYHGGQAEAVRVPFADYGCRKVPDTLSDDQVLFLSSLLPAGWAAVDWTAVKEGDTVAVFGCGPIGLAAQKAAWARGATRVIGIDILPYRLSRAVEICRSEPLNADKKKNGDIVDQILETTDGHGADVCIDAVGMEAGRSLFEKVSNVLHLQGGTPEVLENALYSTRRGGRIAIIGMYTTNYDNFPLGQWMDKGLQITAGHVPVHNYIDELLMMLEGGKIKVDDIISHRMALRDVGRAYELFNNKEDNCIKVVMTP